MSKPTSDNEGARRTEWTAPSIRRLAAGSAEDGDGATADGGQPS